MAVDTGQIVAADLLREEFESVGINASLSGPTAFRSHSVVTASTGTMPSEVAVRIDDHGFHWHVEGRDHRHDLDLHMPSSAVMELVAICVSGRCQDIPAGYLSARVGA